MAEPRRLNIGSGSHRAPGYISVDRYDKHADVNADAACLPYANESIAEIMTSHMVEHLRPEHFRRALREWMRVLHPGGKLMIRCPNIEPYLHRWLEGSYDLRWGEGLAWLIGVPDRGDGYINRNMFTPERLREFVVKAGFEILFSECHPTRSGHMPGGDCLCIARKPKA